MDTASISSNIKPIAQTGLMAKGIVYCLLGIFAFMAAFNIAGQTTNNADKASVFSFIQDQTGGQIMLAVIALGLLSYSLWRGIQTFKDTEHKGNDAKGIFARACYLISGLGYTALAAFAIKMLLTGRSGSGNGRQSMVRDILSKPYGQLLIGIAAGVIIIIGLYQAWYGLSGKYKEHVSKAGGSSDQKILLSSGKVGYVARGIVWLIIGWMFTKAAINSNSSQAGDTSEAFSFLADAAYGSYLLGAVGLGLLCYGIFNFVRVKYETF